MKEVKTYRDRLLNNLSDSVVRTYRKLRLDRFFFEFVPLCWSYLVKMGNNKGGNKNTFYEKRRKDMKKVKTYRDRLLNNLSDSVVGTYRKLRLGWNFFQFVPLCWVYLVEITREGTKKTFYEKRRKDMKKVKTYRDRLLNNLSDSVVGTYRKTRPD